MLGKKQSEARSISLAEVKEILTRRSTEPDFGYEQQTCLDYANKMCKLTPADAKEFESQLSQFEELKPETIMKIIDILPPYTSTLKLILAKDKVTIDDSKIVKIMEIISEAKKKEIAPPAVVEEKKEEGEEKEGKKDEKKEGKKKEEKEEEKKEDAKEEKKGKRAKKPKAEKE